MTPGARAGIRGCGPDRMKQFLITAAGVFAGLVIFMIGVPFVLIAMIASAAGPAPVPTRAVLELDLREPLSDQSPQSPLAGPARRGHPALSDPAGPAPAGEAE